MGGYYWKVIFANLKGDQRKYKSSALNDSLLTQVSD